MKTEFSSYIDMQNFVDAIDKTNKSFVITTFDGKYFVHILDTKTYTAHDGKVYPDEIWVTVDGEAVFIQDLEPEHARNVIRRIIRENEKIAEKLDSIDQEILEALIAAPRVDDSEETDLEDFGEMRVIH
jgi:hypothetical protein